MDFAALKEAFAERGFDDFSDARLGSFINQGRQELDRMFLWPWREKSVTGTSPISITDLGVIEAVINTSQNDMPLAGRQFRDLLDFYGDLSASGAAWCYYVAWPSGTAAVATFPSNADTIGVQYWRVTPDLASASDEPAAPVEVHSLIVDLAVVRGYRAKDNHESARELRAEVEGQLDALLMQYQPGVADSPGHFVAGYGTDG